MPSTNPTLNEGDIVLAALLQVDGQYKPRPTLLLRRMPGYGDYLTCGLSSQLHQLVPEFGELVQPDAVNGLRVPSIIRLEYVSLLPPGRIQGYLGCIPPVLHSDLLQRLVTYLTIH